MTVVLPSSVKSPRKRIRTLTPTKPARGVALNYFNGVNNLNQQMFESGQRIKDLADGGAPADQVSSAIETSQQQSTQAFNVFAAAIATAFVLSASTDSKNKTEGAVARSLNVPRETVTILDAQQIDDIQAAAIAENVQLIKTIPSQYFSQIAQAVSANFSGRPQTGDADSLAGRIQKIGSVTTKRAQFIARDQTAKVTSAVTKSRHEAVGIKKYRWRNSQDQRVVGNPAGLYPKGNKGHGNHWVRENKIFYYARPPFDGNPGQAFNCRCTAEAVLDTDDMDVVFST